jgi:hypothetical protein
MNEREWLSSTDVFQLWRHLLANGKPDVRRLRLFICACCRWRRIRLDDPRLLEALNVAEAFADGRASRQQLRVARRSARLARRDMNGRGHVRVVDCDCVLWATYDGVLPPFTWVEGTVYASMYATAVRDANLWTPAWTHLTAVVHDLFGNPFREPVLGPEAVRWRDGLLGKMAQSVYEERNFADLPLLADALEDAGCTDPDIQGHLRGLGPHVRGCWALDLLT